MIYLLQSMQTTQTGLSIFIERLAANIRAAANTGTRIEYIMAKMPYQFLSAMPCGYNRSYARK